MNVCVRERMKLENNSINYKTPIWEGFKEIEIEKEGASDQNAVTIIQRFGEYITF